MTHRTHTPPIHLARLARAVMAAACLAVASAVALPGPASGHPLGNFTINQYDGVTISPAGVVVDHVVDMAEIPALQERQRMDTDADGVVSDDEAAAWAQNACREGAGQLHLQIGGSSAPLAATSVGISFPAGQAGLLTLRLVCTYEASFPPIESGTSVEFSNDSHADRLGWREIVIRGDGLQLSGAGAHQTELSQRLTAYPERLQSSPPDQRGASFTVTDRGAPLPPSVARDVVPFDSDASEIVGAGASRGLLPGGIADLPTDLSAIIGADDLTPAAMLLSLAVAGLIGAFHAASPGHGKTLMAAYLVGSRGTLRHALILGLTVTITHTVGVFVLGLIVLAAGTVTPAERLFPLLGLASGLLVTALGLAILYQRLRQMRAHRAAHRADRDHGHEHAHGHGHAQAGAVDDGWHSHGPLRHTHLPAANPLKTGNLAALGLIGGLVPSASAILILVGSIVAGRPAYGLVLTVAFGLGMALVLVGLGVLVVRARSLVERWPSSARLAPVLAQLPLVTAVVFVAVGGLILLQATGQLT